MRCDASPYPLPSLITFISFSFIIISHVFFLEVKCTRELRKKQDCQCQFFKMVQKKGEVKWSLHHPGLQTGLVAQVHCIQLTLKLGNGLYQVVPFFQQSSDLLERFHWCRTQIVKLSITAGGTKMRQGIEQATSCSVLQSFSMISRFSLISSKVLVISS